MNMTAICIVFIIIGLPVIAGTVIKGLKIIRGGASPKEREAQAEDARLTQELFKGLRRMEERVEALETIIIDRERQRKERP